MSKEALIQDFNGISSTGDREDETAKKVFGKLFGIEVKGLASA
jgi:hypothetical protein